MNLDNVLLIELATIAVAFIFGIISGVEWPFKGAILIFLATGAWFLSSTIFFAIFTKDRSENNRD